MKKASIQAALSGMAGHAAVRKLRTLVAWQERERLYLVGGAVRDAILDRPVADLDFVFRGDLRTLCESLAQEWPARFVLLNEAWGMVRLVPEASPGSEQALTLDFTPMRGEEIEEDLRQRDFTLNALAVSLGGGLDEEPHALEDPTGGIEDLERRRVRMVHPARLREDPVRLLRAFRIACALGFTIDGETLETIRSEKERLLLAAPERLREEVFKLLACDRSHSHLVKLDEVGLLSTLFPEVDALRGLEQGPHHELDAWKHSLEAFREAEELIESGFVGLSPWSQDLEKWLREETDRVSLLKMAALFHDLGKPLVAASGKDTEVHFHGHEDRGAQVVGGMARRLRMSRRDEECLASLVEHHMWPLHLHRMASVQKLSERAKVRFFRHLENQALGCLILALADNAAKGSPSGAMDKSGSFPDFVKTLLHFDCTRDAAGARTPPLVNGHDLIRVFGLEPGPRIGRLLERVHEARVEGKVKTREDALEFLRAFLEMEDKGSRKESLDGQPGASKKYIKYK
jgi:poly(A) polymerase